MTMIMVYMEDIFIKSLYYGFSVYFLQCVNDIVALLKDFILRLLHWHTTKLTKLNVYVVHMQAK